MGHVKVDAGEYVRWPVVRSEHLATIARVAESGNWHYGPEGVALEAALKNRFNREALATSSCAWSIYLCLRALGISGRVIVPAYGYHGTSHPVVWAGCAPWFVDCDPYSYNLCPDALSFELAGGAFAAIVGVHMHGRPMSEDVFSVARRYGVPVIEDACQAQGASLNGKLVGTMAQAAAFSFNSRKTNPAGLGGACLFPDTALLETARCERDYGLKDTDGTPSSIGSYLPIGEFDAALARAQLPMVDQWTLASNAKVDVLRQVIPLRLPKTNEGEIHVWHKVRIRGSEAERTTLESRGVRTSRWVTKPLPEYSAYSAFQNGSRYPGASEICSSTFCLFDDDHPIACQEEALVRKVAAIIEEVLGD